MAFKIKRKVIVNIALLISALMVSLFVIDVATYFTFNKREYQFEVGMFKKDPNKRYALTPNLQGFLYHRAGKTPFSINSYGYRGPEWNLKAKYRFMFIGDSYTFGIPLPHAELFTVKAESKIGGSTALINLGVPGYGTGHILQVLKENCQKIKPLEVFYMFYRNDLGDQNIRMDYFDIVDGYLVKTYDREWKPRSLESIRAQIAAKPQWSFLDSIRFRNIRQFLSERGIHPTQLLSKIKEIDKSKFTFSNTDQYSMKNIKQATKDILEMKKIAASCGADFTMTILTSFSEDFYGVIEPAVEKLIKELNGRVKIIDIRKFTRDGAYLVQWYDGHYGPAGTDIVSNVLAGYILGRYPALASQN